MIFPKADSVGRYGDMSPHAFLRITFDADRDVCLCIGDENGMTDMEFCDSGSGGGKSPRTRQALIALMVAIEEDNAEYPQRDWYAVRAARAEAARKKE